MFIVVLGQHVSILIESSSGPSKIQILMRVSLRHMHLIRSYIKNVSVLDPAVHFKHC